MPLRKSTPVAELQRLQLARSCYFYHKASKRLYDKYAEIRVIMADITRRHAVTATGAFTRMLREQQGLFLKRLSAD
jgi:hypothetical protein